MTMELRTSGLPSVPLEKKFQDTRACLITEERDGIQLRESEQASNGI